MRTVRLDFLVFGYRRLTFESAKDRADMATALMHKGASAEFRGELELIIRERDYLKNTNIILGQKCKISDNPEGLLPLFRRALRLKFSLAALLFTTLLITLSPSLVWDVRVLGCERLSEAEVESTLSSLGLFAGAPWRKINSDATELSLLDSYPEIGWVSINRRGSVAYVEIIESAIPPSKEEALYSNVVATRDCVIRDISVSSGYAAVKVGQVVRRGEVLISGIPPEETGGELCHASGIVLGECDDEIFVETHRSYTAEVLGDGGKSGLSIKILNFSINIFKIYRNYGRECVIIENNKKCRLFGLYEIPIEILTEYSIPKVENTLTLTDAELVADAAERMREEILHRTKDAELLRLSTSGEFTDGGYVMKTTVTVIEQVGESSKIAVE